jgi:hypothetical protein
MIAMSDSRRYGAGWFPSVKTGCPFTGGWRCSGRVYVATGELAGHRLVISLLFGHSPCSAYGSCARELLVQAGECCLSLLAGCMPGERAGQHGHHTQAPGSPRHPGPVLRGPAPPRYPGHPGRSDPPARSGHRHPVLHTGAGADEQCAGCVGQLAANRPVPVVKTPRCGLLLGDECPPEKEAACDNGTRM